MQTSQASHAVIIFPGMGDDGLHAIRLAISLSNKEAHQHNTDFLCFPFGWKTNLTPQAVQKRYQVLKKKLATLLESYKTVSIMGISTGVALALQYSLDHPQKIKSVVAFCGTIQYNEAYLNLIRHQGVKDVVKKLDQRLDKKDKKIEQLTKKTLVVTTLNDEIVPKKLQRLPGAQRHKIKYPSHLLASTIGVIQHLTQGESSPIWRWLVHGPTIKK